MITQRVRMLPDTDAERIHEVLQVIEALESAGGDERGLRVQARRPKGEWLPQSYRWEGSHRTRSKLPGTSAIRVVATKASVRQALRDHALIDPPLGGGGYEGEWLLLLAGDYAEGGQDPGEIILSNARVLYMWRVPRLR